MVYNKYKFIISCQAILNAILIDGNTIIFQV